MTDRIKSAREFIGIAGLAPHNKCECDECSLNKSATKTILEALSAYERLQGVDLEELTDAVHILETWDTSRDGYIKPKYFPVRDVLRAAQLVADIGGK